jgi:hypothetical protein
LEPPPTIPQFAISYERSGGLAGDPRSLQIAPGRHATAEARGETARFRVGVKQVRRLRRALESANFTSISSPPPNPGSCADCFYYDIAYRGHEVEFSQVDQPRRLVPVVNQLEALIEAHLPFH